MMNCFYTLPNLSIFAEEDLPLPSFRDVFGDLFESTVTGPLGMNNNNQLQQSNQNITRNGFPMSIPSNNTTLTNPMMKITTFPNVSAISTKDKNNYDRTYTSSIQIRKKQRKSDVNDESIGRWTPEEHRLFLEGIMLHGKDWKKMQPLIKTRSLVQIRTHAQKVFKKLGPIKVKELLSSAGCKQSSESMVNGIYDDEHDLRNKSVDGDHTSTSSLSSSSYSEEDDHDDHISLHSIDQHHHEHA